MRSPLTSPSGEAGRTPANVSLSARCLSRVRSSHNSCQQMARGLGARRTRTSRRQPDDHQQARGLSHRRRWRVKRKNLKTYGFVEIFERWTTDVLLAVDLRRGRGPAPGRRSGTRARRAARALICLLMLCPQCRFENPPGMRFCGQCCAPLAARCGQCGAEAPVGFRFCGHCGAPLAHAAAATPAAPSPSVPAPPAQTVSQPIRAAGYTPKHLADKILKGRSALEGERRQVTVLFADVAGFTTLAEAWAASTCATLRSRGPLWQWTRSTRSRAASPRRRSDAASSPRRACASSTRRSVGRHQTATRSQKMN